VFFRNVAN